MGSLVDPVTYIPTITGSSLTSFYDKVVYWEIAKNRNQFFVTFEKGKYAIPNNRQESIATMEITYPHVTANSGSSGSFISSSLRVGARYDAFLEEEEKISGSIYRDYTGFIPTTELQGSRFFQSTLTSSKFSHRTYTYQINTGSGAVLSSSRTVSASYFYPFSSHQLSVLRKGPSLIINLDKESELPNGIGTKGYAIIPPNLHPNIESKLEEFLELASSTINV
tara:strand:- start:572 stop:1240 length:669 start_codon:yes stop_codon:yes gene_type:complete